MLNNLSQKELDDILKWDVKSWTQALKFWERNSDLEEKTKVLALGENEGGLSLYFAMLGCEVICSDYKLFPESTKKMHIDYNVDQRITYSKIDMMNIDLEDNSVDAVVFKSVIGVLGSEQNQSKALTEIYRVLKKGGTLLFAENLEGSKLHRALRKRFVRWGESWCYVTKNSVKSKTSNFSSYNYKSVGVVALFGRNEKQRRFLAYLDKVLLPITPKKWRYILLGVLVK